jgi:uncharacterized iron-regulated protein
MTHPRGRWVLAAVSLVVLGWSAGLARAECTVSDAPVDVITAEWAKTCTHPLCGFVVQAGKPRDANQVACRHDSWRPLLERMNETRLSGGVTLLGEVHDNGEHHKLRAVLLEGNGAAVFEHIRADQQAALDQFVAFDQTAARRGTYGDLLSMLEWNKSAWSRTADYRPLFSAVVSAHLPVYAGDPPRDAMRTAAKEGLAAALPPADRTRLGLDMALGAANDAASLAEIEGSHCGMIPKAAHPNMAAAQRYRDAHLADALLTAAKANGSAILFAGNGHVRTDRGVPWYIRARATSTAIVSVMLIEVQDGKIDPEAYVPRDPDGKPAADFVIFTPPGPDRDKDPCEAMKAAMTKAPPAQAPPIAPAPAETPAASGSPY